jgi:hypothetical protein
VCAIVGCENPVATESVVDAATGGTTERKRKACALPFHQGIENKHNERGTASFLLHQRLQRARTAFPSKQPVIADSRTPLDIEHNMDLQEDEETFFQKDDGEVVVVAQPNPGTVGVEDHPQAAGEPCPSKPDEGNRRLKAKFGRVRTHNKQTLVRPCGVVFARATMYGAEAVSNFLIMLKNAFSVPGSRKPEHIFYDTNCLARQQADKDPWFDGIGMCVDVWHFKNKHAVTHEYCQTHCNPAMYPELMENGKWVFNTSVAEQINAWLGGYLAICREMSSIKYDFFLDEMIRLHNISTLKRLQASGTNPRVYNNTT